jgi:hypothetical protein
MDRRAGFKRAHAGALMTLLCLAFLAVMPGRAAALPADFWGVNPGGHEAQREEMDYIKESGVQVLRHEINWCAMATNGWGGFERVVRLAWERGLYVLPILSGNLACKNTAGRYPYPENGEWEPQGSAWEQFVYYAVQRFGYAGSFWVGKASPRPMGVWEVGNEPNTTTFAPQGVVDAKQYGRFLKRTSQVIHAAEKGGVPTVLAGGLLTVKTQNGNVSVKNFIEGMHSVSGVAASYDGLSLHPYAFKATYEGPPRNPPEVGQVKDKVRANIEEARTALGATAKPIWITELGWPNSPGGDASHPGVSEAVAAELVTTTFNMIQAQWANLGIVRAFYYNIRDFGGSEWDDYTGLRTASGAFRPAWNAWRGQTGAASWPNPIWHTFNIGGSIAGDPDVSTWGPGRLDVFARSSTGTLLTKYFDNGVWSGWSDLGGSMASSPTAVSADLEQISVFARASNGNLVQWWFDPQYGQVWHYGNLGGNITGTPDVASFAPGRLDVFARGANGALVTKYFAGGAWSGWSEIGGSLAEGSGPGAVSWGPGRIDVVGRAPNNSVEHWWFDTSLGSVWQKENFGGQISGDPDIASMKSGRLDIFAATPSGTLATKYFDEGSWSGWAELGGSLAAGSGPGAVSGGLYQIHVFGRAPNGTVAQWWFSR